MADILPFKSPRGKRPAQGQALCRNGFHKWAIDQKKQFDVKRGRLVTVRRCSRCGTLSTTLA